MLLVALFDVSWSGGDILCAFEFDPGLEVSARLFRELKCWFFGATRHFVTVRPVDFERLAVTATRLLRV